MATSRKLDLYKKHKAEYITPKTPKLVEIEPASYLAIAGRGEPGTDAFAAKVGCLYAMAFTIKMASNAAGRDYVVCKLEGLWWGTGEENDLSLLPQDQWNWKLLIRAGVHHLTGSRRRRRDAEEKGQSFGRGRGATGNDPGGALRANAARRAVLARIGDDRRHDGVCSGEWPVTARPAPRNLPLRSPPRARRAAAHDPAASGPVAWNPYRRIITQGIWAVAFSQS